MRELKKSCIIQEVKKKKKGDNYESMFQAEV